jgi:hypothetical protein
MKKPNKSAAHIALPFPGSASIAAKRRKSVPHEFVLDALSPVNPWTRPMFGCTAVYVGEKVALILRDKPDSYVEDNGVWLATTRDHHESLRQDFPAMRSIAALAEGVTSWQVLPADAADFEEMALRACAFVVAGDPRIGKIPGSRRPKKSKPRQPVKSGKPAGKSRRRTRRKSRK